MQACCPPTLCLWPSKVSSFVASLGLATVPTIIVMSVYIFSFDQKLKKKLPVSLYPSSLQELLLLCLFYLIRLISLSIPKQLEVLIILVYWKVIWLEGRVWQATICSLSITYPYRCIRNLDAPIHFILLIMAFLLSQWYSVDATETLWSTELKIFTTCHIIRQVC